MILAFNLNAAMKQLALGGSWAARRMKAIAFFPHTGLPGRVMTHARELVIRLARAIPSLKLLLDARQRIMELGVYHRGNSTPRSPRRRECMVRKAFSRRTLPKIAPFRRWPTNDA